MRQIDEAHLEQGKFYVATYTTVIDKKRRYEEVFVGVDGNLYLYDGAEGETIFYAWEEESLPKDITFWEMV